jgi:hypothetical protein
MLMVLRPFLDPGRFLGVQFVEQYPLGFTFGMWEPRLQMRLKKFDTVSGGLCIP